MKVPKKCLLNYRATRDTRRTHLYADTCIDISGLISGHCTYEAKEEFLAVALERYS